MAGDRTGEGVNTGLGDGASLAMGIGLGEADPERAEGTEPQPTKARKSASPVSARFI